LDLGARSAFIVHSIPNRSDSQVLALRIYVQGCQLLTVGEVLQRQPWWQKATAPKVGIAVLTFAENYKHRDTLTEIELLGKKFARNTT
jgi:hypothetical protein